MQRLCSGRQGLCESQEAAGQVTRGRLKRAEAETSRGWKGRPVLGP